MERTVKMTCIGVVYGIGSQSGYEMATLVPLNTETIVQEVKVTVKRGVFTQGKRYDWPCIGVLADLIEEDKAPIVSDVFTRLRQGLPQLPPTIVPRRELSGLRFGAPGGQTYSDKTIAIVRCLFHHPGLTIPEIRDIVGYSKYNYNSIYSSLSHHRGVLFVKGTNKRWFLEEGVYDERQGDQGDQGQTGGTPEGDQGPRSQREGASEDSETPAQKVCGG